MQLRHPEAPITYRVIWDRAQRGSTDLAMGGQIDSELYPGKDLNASGSTEVSILYIQAFSWNLPGSPVADRATRLCLRNHFYRALEAQGITPIRSFLPTSIAGIEEFKDKSADKPLKPFKVKAVRRVLRTGFRVRVAPGNAKSYDVDIHTIMTGLLVEDPEGDVRFMVRSKEGIRLPDPTGRLASETAKTKLDLAAINQILWDDAVVWPVVRYTDGIWSTMGKFDFSMLNLNLPPTDLSWIGLK